jgi:hypothetical protein
MVAVATYTPLNAPYVSNDEIITALRTVIPQRWNVPIYDEFPSVTDNVRYGLYVSDVIVAQRNAVQLGLTFCGAIYNAVDTFTVVYISFQQDPYEQDIANIVSDLVTLQVDGVPLFGSYVNNSFTQDLSYGPTRAAIHTWTFELTRPEFNT